MKTYIIDYCVYLNDGYFESHTMKVKNAPGEAVAKVRLEGYLKKKWPNFNRLVVYKCREDILGGMGMNGLFGNIFK